MVQQNAPLISPETNLPEITLKAVILGILLSIILGASNVYLALKVGNTVAASIPAAVISMGVFRFFRKSNVLETNLVQTAASAGEGLATSVSFILPALIILGYWSDFGYWQTAIISILGGLFGVFISVLLRRTLLSHPGLGFPEGTAVGNVLKAQSSSTSQMKPLMQGISIGGLMTLGETGFKIISDHFAAWFKTGKTLWGLSFGLNPVLIGIGFIVGFNVGLNLFMGTIIAWIVGVPILSRIYGIPHADNVEDMVMTLWSQHIRYIGVGTMIVGGIWTLMTLIKPVAKSAISGYQSMKHMKNNTIQVLRTEKDFAFRTVALSMGGILILMFFLIFYSLRHSGLPLSSGLTFTLSLTSIFYILVFGFLSSIVAGYIVGLVGSSNSPMSGIFIMNLLLLCAFLLPLLHLQVDFSNVVSQKTVIAVIIFILMMAGSAIVITLENIQDLKAGQMVGATPWKQQVMMMVGVISAALTIPYVMHLLFQAYGIGGVLPRAGMDASQMLTAPQSNLLAALAQSVIGHNLPFSMLMTGMVIGVGFIFIDEYVKRKKIGRMPPLAIGIGIYLPPMLSTGIFMGSLVRFFADRHLKQKLKTYPEDQRHSLYETSHRKALLIACGLVAGASLMGVILAIPFLIKGSADALQLVPDSFAPTADIIGVVLIAALCAWLYRTASMVSKKN